MQVPTFSFFGFGSGQSVPWAAGIGSGQWLHVTLLLAAYVFAVSDGSGHWPFHGEARTLACEDAYSQNDNPINPYSQFSDGSDRFVRKPDISVLNARERQ